MLQNPEQHDEQSDGATLALLAPGAVFLLER
jgi:hypothetical protein